jgi:hypothetical protein
VLDKTWKRHEVKALQSIKKIPILLYIWGQKVKTVFTKAPSHKNVNDLYVALALAIWKYWMYSEAK